MMMLFVLLNYLLAKMADALIESKQGEEEAPAEES